MDKEDKLTIHYKCIGWQPSTFMRPKNHTVYANDCLCLYVYETAQYSGLI